MTSRDVLEDVVDWWKEEVAGERVIARDIMGEVEQSLDMEEITVIKGVRRTGKTFILYALLRKHGGIYINFEDERLMDFSAADFDKVADIMKFRGERILYLDEVQEVEGWEKFAHRAHRRFKIVVTGSNSKLLSGEYAGALVGRTRSFTISPLSFREFLRFRGLRPERESLISYLKIGGFPRIVLTGEISLVREYFERSLYRDIIARESIKYPEALKDMAFYLLSNVGKEFSYRSLRDVTGIAHESTLKEYLGLLRNAFLVDIIKKYSPSLKKQAVYSKKLYAVDPALVHMGKRYDEDRGRVFENAVYLHLKRKYDVYFLKNGKEVDFLACDGLRPLKMLNAVYEAEGESAERELASLRYFRKKYEIPAEIVALYGFDVPEGIELRLAHRWMHEF